jgi:tripartite-type tricarboxylate transporter receptor subunit TctC
MAGELFSHVAGIKMVHVPYKGAAPAMTAVMAGEVDMMFNALPPTLPHIKSGKVRAIAIGSAKRTDLLPGVPTILESGIDFATEGWYGVVAPKGTPQPVIDTLHKALVQAMGSAEMKASMTKLAVETSATTPAAFAKFIREENQRWAKVIKAAGIKMK